MVCRRMDPYIQSLCTQLSSWLSTCAHVETSNPLEIASVMSKERKEVSQCCCSNPGILGRDRAPGSLSLGTNMAPDAAHLNIDRNDQLGSKRLFKVSDAPRSPIADGGPLKQLRHRHEG